MEGSIGLFFWCKSVRTYRTPTPEAYSYFNNNVIEKYTYDDSVVDGVNVPSRVYRITTEVTEHGGTIEAGTEIIEAPKGKSETTTYAVTNTIEYVYFSITLLLK